MSWQPPSKTYSIIDLRGTLVRSDHPTAPLVAVAGMHRLYRQPDGAWCVYDGDNLATYMRSEDVQQVTVQPSFDQERRTPTWATVLGIIGLFIFLIGIVFFFVKETVNVPCALVEIVGRDGKRIAFKVRNVDPYVLQASLR